MKVSFKYIQFSNSQLLILLSISNDGKSIAIIAMIANRLQMIASRLQMIATRLQ